ncbi:MAG: triple tyrosine motif-containing protein, partial [Melioribacteraceae bacterium]|nr:triple tyrosine motif-containing protein [Melioribacteraceae bacterium]
YEDDNNKLWIGTFDAGLNLLDPISEKFTVYKNNSSNNSINHNQVMDIIHYSNDSILVATFGGGINILNNKTYEFSHHENSPIFELETEHKNIRKLYDDGSKIWIGSYNGLYQYDKKQKKMNKFIFEHDNLFSINNNKIREIFEDDNGIIWIGTNYGVNQYDANRKKFDFHSFNFNNNKFLGDKFDFPQNLISSEIQWPIINFKLSGKERAIKYYGDSEISGSFKSKYSVNFYEDENNTLWMGDYDGLKYYDKNELEFKYIEFFNDERSDLSNNFIKNFYFDSNGDFWAGTLGGGLTHYSQKTKQIKRYVHDEMNLNSISDSRVFQIYEDKNGEFWIGTYGGLNKFDRDKEVFKRYLYDPNDNSTISNDRIYSIFESDIGELWVGTYQGLNRYKKTTDNFEHITTEDGIADNTIFGILEDDENNLWLRTQKGISKYDPLKKTVKNYFKNDGLIGLEANSSISYKNKDGKMFFSGLNGFNSFYPSEIKENQLAPNIVFTELLILDHKIDVGNEDYLQKSLNDIDELILSHKDKVFSIEFSALHFASPMKNKYAYMLEGFIDQWTYVDANHRVASFTNLSAGEYFLHVKASNNDGIWNEVGRSLKIIVTPPYWETWWFRLAAFATILFLIFIIYEVRLARLVEIERTRARIARNLHDDVGGTLASIQYFVDAIKKNKNENHMNKFLDLIMASSNDAQEKIRDIIWTVNPKEDGLSRFLVKFNRHASDLLDSHNIKYKINLPKIEDEKKIGMEKRQHLWCICKETITNIIRHSNCENVNIIFALDGNKLQYSIQDDGVGFDKSSTLPGDGLTNIAFRSEKLGASYSIDTEVKKGLKFEIICNI